MSEIYHIPQSALYLRRGPFTRPAEPTRRGSPITRPPAEPAPDAQVGDPRASSPGPVAADGFFWLVGMLWKRWSARRRSQPSRAVDPSIQEQAVERRLHRLAREI